MTDRCLKCTLPVHNPRHGFDGHAMHDYCHPGVKVKP